MSSSDHWTQGKDIPLLSYYFQEIMVSKDRMHPPAGCPQDSGNRAVLPHEHRGNNAMDVAGTDLKLTAGSQGKKRGLT
ncbi:hypothetical protein E2C01_043488 [Portunus trituberculatus]|uniref:Uncharacterized protein n=1 Tax=Portunus trituberculatus TaxID=210409 RepID=A0A5B7FW98_PORTR|nr:hypothetical protein [Portunus trituberculatus]